MDSIVWSPERLHAAVAQAAAAIEGRKLAPLSAALNALDEVETWGELLAEVAEEGRAAELAARIPGARCVDGMLALAPEHVALLERAVASRSTARATIDALRREKRRAQLTRALKKHAQAEAGAAPAEQRGNTAGRPASGAQALTLEECRGFVDAYLGPNRVEPLGSELAQELAPLVPILSRWDTPEALFDVARLSFVDAFPHEAFERASAAGSLPATHVLFRRALAAQDATELARLDARSVRQGDAYRAFERAVTAAGHAAQRAEAFARFVEIARALPGLPETTFLDRYVQAATRALGMMKVGLVPHDAALEAELLSLRAPHATRFARLITETQKLFGLR